MRRAGLAAALVVAAAAGAEPASAITIEQRSPTSAFAQNVSNTGTGGATNLGCRAKVTWRPCLVSTNADSGVAFLFKTQGLLGGTIAVGAGGPDARPFTTNATGVATGLNADMLDGRSASDFLPAGGTAVNAANAANAAKLDGLTAAAFLRADGTAADAAKLDGLTATAFLRADGTAADAAKLGGRPASDYITSVGGKVGDSDKLDGKDSADFLAATGTAADAAQLGGQPPSAFLAATGTAADAAQLGGQPPSAFLGATAKAADAEQLDGLDASELVRATRLVGATGGRILLDVGDTDVPVLTVGGVALAATCADVGGGIVGVTITANASADDTFVGVRGYGVSGSYEIDAATPPAAVVEENGTSITTPGVAPVSISLEGASGPIAAGELSIGLDVFGADCTVSGSLVTS